MSAVALANLQQLWEKLTFHTVDRVIAREPEDVAAIWIDGGARKHCRTLSSNRTADIPPIDRDRATVIWRHYYGFTRKGAYFQKADYHGLDCDVDVTLLPSRYANHDDSSTKPAEGALICGKQMLTQRGMRIIDWFHCSPQFKFLVEIVRNGTTLTEDQLARRLVTKLWTDMYWAIARLVLFDNVSAFVDDLDWDSVRPPHPAHGMLTGDINHLSGEPMRVEHQGMHVPGGAQKFLGLLGRTLGEPKWAEEFVRLACERGLENNLFEDHAGDDDFENLEVFSHWDVLER